MVRDEVPMQIIKELSGLEVTSLKRYLDKGIDQYEKELKEKILNENHPYKILYAI